MATNGIEQNYKQEPIAIGIPPTKVATERNKRTTGQILLNIFRLCSVSRENYQKKWISRCFLIIFVMGNVSLLLNIKTFYYAKILLICSINSEQSWNMLTLFWFCFIYFNRLNKIEYYT